jgi:TatD family-associated radical SAM protein
MIKYILRLKHIMTALTTKPEERPKGRIAYEFSTPFHKRRTLYLNVIPEYSCVNSCRFCSRKNAILEKENIYEKKAGTSLYLPQAPAVEEVMQEANGKIRKGLFGGTRELAFVGLGEPLLEFGLVADTISALRADGFRGRIRVDTNGLVNCWRGDVVFGCFEIFRRNPAEELKKAGLTDIRISLNAVNAQDYYELCRPEWGEDKAEWIFGKLCTFITDCIRVGINTAVSFVVGFNDGEVKTRSEDDYRDFALSLGIKPKNVLMREYVEPCKSPPLSISASEIR